MEWMGKLSETSGPICCANEKCKLQVGRYDWTGLALEQVGPKTALFNEGECSVSSETSQENAAVNKRPLFIAPAFRIEAGLVVIGE